MATPKWNVRVRAVTAVVAVLGAALSAQSTMVTRPAQGFALPLPTGWVEKADAEVAAVIVQKAQPAVTAMVFVQTESVPAAVTDVLAKASVRLKSDTARKVVSSSFDVLLDRPVLKADLEDATTRYRLTLVPRDQGERSQVFYGVMLAAPKAAFTKLAPALDRIVAGFQIVPMAAAAAGPGAAPGARAAASAPPAPVASTLDRAKVIERILAPKGQP